MSPEKRRCDVLAAGDFEETPKNAVNAESLPTVHTRDARENRRRKLTDRRVLDLGNLALNRRRPGWVLRHFVTPIWMGNRRFFVAV